MPSIRNTKSSTQSLRKAKKRLKREIAELRTDMTTLGKKSATWLNIFALDAINFEIESKKQELQQLKRKKR